MSKSLVLASTTAGLAVALGLLARRYLDACRALRRERSRKEELALALLTTRSRVMHTEESTRIGRTFSPRSDDVFVVTYPKCGTTWVTQIVHALRGGTMDFGDICEVAPWDTMAHFCGQDVNAPQAWQPRLFKSHETHEHVAKGGRYIYVARDPLDAFVSFHKFFPSYHCLRPDDLSAEAFAQGIAAPDGDLTSDAYKSHIWAHVLGWWRAHAEGKAPILLVFYEDLLADLRGSVARIARWLGLPADAAALDEVCRVSSFAFMAAPENVHRYDEHFVRRRALPAYGLPADTPIGVAKVRKGGGKAGGKDALPPAVRRRLDECWREVMAGPTGCEDYQAFHAAMSGHRGAWTEPACVR